jgi:hypothetical protein
MLEPHKRATLIPNEPGVSWHHFLRGRFLGPFPQAGRDASLAILVQSIQQQSQEHAEIRGFTEQASGSSLPVVSEFVGVLNVESREISIHQIQPEKIFSGQISENGRVIVLRQSGDSKPVNLVHEETLAQFL